MTRDPLDESLEALGKATRELEAKIDALSQPVRSSAFRRFPILFTLLVAFGVSAVMFGFEQFFLDVPLFNNNPLFVLLGGVLILILTGTLYKKL